MVLVKSNFIVFDGYLTRMVKQNFIDWNLNFLLLTRGSKEYIYLNNKNYLNKYILFSSDLSNVFLLKIYLELNLEVLINKGLFFFGGVYNNFSLNFFKYKLNFSLRDYFFVFFFCNILIYFLLYLYFNCYSIGLKCIK